MKKIIHGLLSVLKEICLPTLIVSLFLTEHHIAFFNITVYVTLLVALAYRFYLKNDFLAFDPKIIIVFLLIFFIPVVSMVLHHEPLNVIWKNSRSYILLLVLPIIFCLFPQSKYDYNTGLFVVIIFVISTLAVAQYYGLIQFRTVEDYGAGGRISFPALSVSHQLLALYCVSGVIFGYRTLAHSSNNRLFFNILLAIIISTMFVYLHLIGSRTGLVVIYVLLCLFLFNSSKVFRIAIVAVIVAGVLVVVGNQNLYNQFFWTIDEIGYMISKGFSNIENRGNISLRAMSLKYSMGLIREHFWLGISIPDYDTKIVQYFSDIGLVAMDKPANQWVKYAICFGVPLTLLYFVLFCIPVFLNKNFKDNVILGVFVMLLAETMTEAPFEYHNVYHFCFFVLCMSWRYGNGSKTAHKQDFVSEKDG